MAHGVDPHSEPVLLREGRSVLVREASAEDAPRIAALLSGLVGDPSSAAVAGTPHGLTAEHAQLLTAVTGDGVVLVATAGNDDRLVGLASFRTAPATPDAEFALAVAESWHGRGLGTALIERLVARAAARGLDGLWALVPPGNEPVLRLVRDLDIDVSEQRVDAGVHLRLAVGPSDAFAEAAVQRFAESAARSLEPMFRPRAIAVVGASQNPESPGGTVFRSLADGTFPGPVFAVNTARGEVAGHRAYPSLREIPEHVDLVVVAVPAVAVPQVARDAVAAGARAMIVLSSGFAEVGGDGAALQNELVSIVRAGGIRMLGPNCLGLAVNAAASFDATFGGTRPPDGRIALGSQSGGIGLAALAYADQRGLGLSAFASLGNKGDVSSNDLLAWWARDDTSRAILLYLESFGNPRHFARLARRVARRKPILALKAGRGSAGRRAASSHSAALAAGDVLTDALFNLAGVVRVDTVEDFFEAAEVLVNQPLPKGRRVAIISNAGGPGILAADACEAEGLVVPALDTALRERVEAAAASVAGSANPIDLGAGADAEAFATVGRVVLDADAVDALLVLYTPVAGGETAAVIEAVEALADGRVPVVGSLVGGELPRASAAAWPVPWLDFPESAARALACGAQAAEAAERAPDPSPPVLDADTRAARRALRSADPGEWLDPEAVEAVLRAYRLPVPASRRASSAQAAAEVQRELGRPVAVKLLSPTITHKSDVGGVVLGCGSPEEAGDAYLRIERSLEAAGRRDEMDGVLVQEQVPDGLDLIVGGLDDPVFGPVVLGGMGGTQAELWADRAVALAPIGPRTASALWDELRGSPLLDGYRGSPPVDRAALADIAWRVSRLIAEQAELTEIDCNPVRVGAEGSGAVIVDARIRRAASTPSGSEPARRSRTDPAPSGR